MHHFGFNVDAEQEQRQEVMHWIEAYQRSKSKKDLHRIRFISMQINLILGAEP